jgi:cell division protein FtsZ
MEEEVLKFDFPKAQPSIIKVIGVGGGGGNAVTHMYREGIRDVTFALCNTDSQALIKSEVPVKIQLGKMITEGLGAGNDPEKAKLAAEESVKDVQNLLSDGTKMVFVTAGMGGGTGTGAAPIVAKVAKDMNILTIGIVTIPFLFELRPKIIQALEGVEKIRRNVDALLVINNERLIDIYGEMDMIEAFKKADSTLSTAARSIAEIITTPGHINLDFADVNTTLRNGGVAVMSSGFGEGDNRVSMAFEDALNSPLLNNNDVIRAKKILFNIYFGSDKPLKVSEMNEINDFMARFDSNINVIWGVATDDSLKENIKVTILATGFGQEDIPMMSELDEESARKAREKAEKEEQDRIEREERERRLLGEHYDKAKVRNLGKTIRPEPFIFDSVLQLDDNEIIDAIIDQPAYKRSPGVLSKILEKREALQTSSPEENVEEKDNTTSNTLF